jgi:hypothetical protein
VTGLTVVVDRTVRADRMVPVQLISRTYQEPHA